MLIVEDNADVRTYIRGFLQKTLQDRRGEEWQGSRLEKARDTTIDLVISDIMMPVMDGIALCRALKSDEATSHIPVILLTAQGNPARGSSRDWTSVPMITSSSRSTRAS